MSDHKAGSARTKRSKRQPTAGWLIRQLMKHPPDALVVVLGQGCLDGMHTNMKAVEVLPERADGGDADYHLQYVDSRRPGRKIVAIW